MPTNIRSDYFWYTKNRQISQAFSHTYLVGAVIVLILSPIALLTDRKPLKS
ncbi:MFS transporter [Levilactobacillus brevis]|nr:MFS transporter [Levilactobacillus brevis]MCT3579421.1 MFS transporter [Levilactobacillus brevis]